MPRRSRPSSFAKAQVAESEVLEEVPETGLQAKEAQEMHAMKEDRLESVAPKRSKRAAGNDSLVGRLRRRVRLLSRLPVLLMVACTLMAVGSLQAVWHIGTGLTRSAQWQAEADELHAKNAALGEDIRVLEEARANLQTPEYLGEVARCLGFVGAGERVLVAENAPRTVGSNCDVRRLP